MTLAIAHRGEPMGHRENTVRGFLAARDAGADMIELDCRLARDGTVVVLHDATLARLWGVDRPVSELDGKDVMALGDDECRIPELSEVLGAVDLPVMVDVADRAVMPAALSAVTQAAALGRCLFAGDLEGLLMLRRARADARIALTWDHQQRPGELLLDELRPEYFNPRWDLLDDDAVAYFHGRGIAISVWTVDDTGLMNRLIGMGADAIITNRITDLVRALGRDEGR